MVYKAILQLLPLPTNKGNNCVDCNWRIRHILGDSKLAEHF